MVSARHIPARRARKNLASFAHGLGTNCFGPQFPCPFQIGAETDETTGRGGMANRLGGGRTGTTAPSPFPRTLSTLTIPVSPKRDLQPVGAPLAWWVGVPGYLEARTG